MIDWSSGASPFSSVRTISSSRASAASKLSSPTSVSAVAMSGCCEPHPPSNQGEWLFDRCVLEGIADARENFVAHGFVTRIRKRRLRLTHMTLAFAAQLLDERLAVAVEAGVGRRLDARRLRCLGDRGIELALGRQAEFHRILGRDIRHVPMAAVADRGDGGPGGADQLADLPVADLGMVLDDPVDAV